MFKRDIWCLDQCSAFKPSSLNKINCGDAGLAVCGVTMGGEGCTPLPRLVHMKYLAVVTGSHCDFIGGLERPTSPVRTQYSDCHLSSHITLGLFLLTPQPPRVDNVSVFSTSHLSCLFWAKCQATGGTRLRGLFDNEFVEWTRDPPWRDGQTEGQVDPVLLPAHLLQQLD